MCSPSVSAKKLASSPRRNSSTTTSLPGIAERAAEHRIDGLRADSAGVSAMMTPLPCGKPVGLDDDRVGQGGGVALGGGGSRETAR